MLNFTAGIRRTTHSKAEMQAAKSSCHIIAASHAEIVGLRRRM
jgi:hypothetical protein